MPAIPPQLLKSIPVLTQVVSEVPVLTSTLQNSAPAEWGALQQHLEARLADAVEDLVQTQLDALKPLLRARIQAVLQEVMNDYMASTPHQKK